MVGTCSIGSARDMSSASVVLWRQTTRDMNDDEDQVLSRMSVLKFRIRIRMRKKTLMMAPMC